MVRTILRHRSAVDEDSLQIQRAAPEYTKIHIQKSQCGRRRLLGIKLQRFLSELWVGSNGDSHTYFHDRFDRICANSGHDSSMPMNINNDSFMHEDVTYGTTVIENGSSATLGGDSTLAGGENPTHIGNMLNLASNAYPANDLTQDSDDDSALGEELFTATTSMESSVTKYVKKHGRLYHAYHAGKYVFPNDEDEQALMDLLHEAIKEMLGNKLFMAPIEADGSRILDIGTGTGQWAIEMGELYRGARITGNDLSPIQPEWVPNNVNFLVDDVESVWIDIGIFHFIKASFLGAAIKDWPQLIRRIYKALKPGGWVEFRQLSPKYTFNNESLAMSYPDHAFLELNKKLEEACGLTERMFDPTPYLEQWILQEGFKMPERQDFKIPIGTWPTDERERQVGAKMSKIVIDGVHALTAVLLGDILHWRAEEAELLNMKVRKEAKSGLEVMQDLVVIWAQKPE